MGTIRINNDKNVKITASWAPMGVAVEKSTPAFCDFELFKDTHVKKRNGTIVDFDPMKIVKAVDKARIECGIDITNDPDHDKYFKTMSSIFNEINESFKMNKSDTIKLEAIQDIVVANLWMCYTREVADEYHSYRFKRELERNGNIITKYKKRVASDDIENSNANVDEQSFSGKEKESGSDISKYVALNTGVLSKSVANAHKEMLVYQHDLEKAQYGVHNCLFPDIAHVFKNGFDARNGDVRCPGSFACACQQFAVIIQCQSQVQFGGAGAVHFDYDLVPYVRKSYRKHMLTEIEKVYNRKHTSLKNKLKYRRNMSLIKELKKSDGLAMESELEAKLKKAFPFAYEEATQDLEYEGLQSLEAMYHNLNTLESRQGSQVPFSSINLGKDTTPEGRLVNRWTFETSIAGIGKNHLTSIFPISIFSYKKGVNSDPGDPNYDMKQLALKSLSKRIYPNFANCDWSQAHEDPNDPDTDFALMG